VEGSGEPPKTNDDQDFSPGSDRPGPASRTPGGGGDPGKGTCPVCGQQAELMRTMTGPVIRNHGRGRDGEPFCPGTGEPSAEAETAP